MICVCRKKICRHYLYPWTLKHIFSIQNNCNTYCFLFLTVDNLESCMNTRLPRFYSLFWNSETAFPRTGIPIIIVPCNLFIWSQRRFDMYCRSNGTLIHVVSYWPQPTCQRLLSLKILLILYLKVHVWHKENYRCIPEKLVFLFKSGEWQVTEW